VKATVTNTSGIFDLVMNASGRNRSVYEDKFMAAVDPQGTHVLSLQIPHNDVEMRTQWMCKMRDIADPVSIWLDVDFDVLRKVSKEVEVKNV
tara:strand:+ start:14 stop:289 length:276 start_codon:yes stop_codon:yes gene_type:complete